MPNAGAAVIIRLGNCCCEPGSGSGGGPIYDIPCGMSFRKLRMTLQGFDAFRLNNCWNNGQGYNLTPFDPTNPTLGFGLEGRVPPFDALEVSPDHWILAALEYPQGTVASGCCGGSLVVFSWIGTLPTLSNTVALISSFCRYLRPCDEPESWINFSENSAGTVDSPAVVKVPGESALKWKGGSPFSGPGGIAVCGVADGRTVTIEPI